VTAVARTADNRTAATNITVSVNNATAPAPPPAPQPGNLIANPSVDSGTGSTPAGWSSVRWGTNTATFSWLTSGHTGARSVRTEITAYTNGDARWHHTAATVTAGRTYQYTGWYQSNVATEIDVEVTMTNGTKQYVYLATAPASTAWAKATAQYTAPAGAAKVIVYQVLSRKGWLVGDDVALSEYAPTQLGRGMVSLTFDDGWLNQLTNAKPLLDRYGMKATFYVLSGVSDWDGYMTQQQMGTLAGAGHEIASHTISHPHLTALPASTMDGELRTSQSTLRQWYGPSVAKNFASPYGEYNAAVQAASRAYYRSHRSTDEGFNTEDDTDVDNLKVQNILDTTTPAQVGAWVDQAVRDRSWLILVYHEVGTGLEDPTYAVTPANLDAELRLIQSKGIAVRTVDQALDEIVPQLG
jgi:peptidoglycan/xylan/chitin deacetylase (PgdA/CDA1 family)